jgi:hypothetical protein
MLNRKTKIIISVLLLVTVLVGIGVGLYLGVFKKSHTVRPTKSLSLLRGGMRLSNANPTSTHIPLVQSPYTILFLFTKNSKSYDIDDFTDALMWKNSVVDGKGRVVSLGILNFANDLGVNLPLFGFYDLSNGSDLYTQLGTAMTKASKIGKQYNTVFTVMNCKITPEPNQYNNLLSQLGDNYLLAICETNALMSQLTSRIKPGTVIDTGDEVLKFDNCDSLISPENFIKVLPNGKSNDYYQSELSKLY